MTFADRTSDAADHSRTASSRLRRNFACWRCLVACAALIVSSASAAGDEKPAAAEGEILSRSAATGALKGPAVAALNVGFADVYRVGCWTPIEVELLGGETELRGRVELSLLDGDGMPSEIQSEELVLPAGQRKRTLIYAKFGRLGGDVTAAFRSGEQIAFSRVFSAGPDADADFSQALPSSDRMILQIGDSIGIEEVLARQRRDAAERTVLVALDDAGQLPTRWFGYEGVDTLVLSVAEDQAYAPLMADPERLEALEEWVELGGHVMLACGAEAPRLLAPESPLARFSPGKFAELIALPKTTSLETYSGVSSRVEAKRGRGILAARLDDLHATVELREGDLPLVVRAPRGFGRVTFLAIDLSREPLAAWPGRIGLVHRLLGGAARRANEDEQDSGRAPAVHLGITDLAGQLRGALDQFAGVELAPFWLVAALIFVYLLLIGPLDFLLHRKLTGRMALSWVTFPFWVLLFSAGAYWGAERLKGNQLRVNQVDLVDVDVASNRVRGTTWLNLFSPETTQYDLSLAPQIAGLDATSKRESLWSWMGLPGPALGGMEHPAAGPRGVSQSYRFAPGLDATQGVSIPIWSSKSFTGRWQCRATPGVDSRLKAGEDGVAEGRLTSRLAAPLTGSLLICGRWAYQLGEIAPGQTVAIRPGEQRDLQAVLKDFRLIKEGKQLVQISTPYDQSGFDLRSIVQQMMFYEAGGGRRYTGLANRYQQFTDLSDRLDLGQAILWGSMAGQAAELQDDGRPLAGANESHSTFYRFVLPLEQK